MTKIQTPFLLFLLLILLSCNQKKEQKEYTEHIGDTVFNPKIDHQNFKFCDTSKVFHSRSLIGYIGGQRAIEKEFLQQFVFDESFQDFTGTFSIRLALNCKRETGRFRWEILDNQFRQIDSPKKLEEQVITIVRNLKNWEHINSETNPDGYCYIILNFNNGKLILS
ncbi:hypothetical protein [Aureivirga marina]|uniref:hypothetical protein n=1 Tax=Aureivirga marina TaxID=1182451 RepID=UPI0018CA644A|nr:hypothetical protein [Aureivirga marina]